MMKTPTTGAAPDVWTREEAIGRIRAGLLRLSDGEHSMCQVAAEFGVFCRGFRRWNDHEFHRRWKTVIGQSTHLTRPQMEELADIWQFAEQLRLRVPLACDAQTIARGACRGWNEFSNADLERYCDEILDRNVVIRIESTQNAQNDPAAVKPLPGLDSKAGPGSILGATLGGIEFGPIRETP